MPRHLTLSITALIAGAALASCGVVGGLADGHLDIEQAELQARVAPRFPTQHCKFVVACVDLSHPVVLLPEGDNRIALTLDARVSLATRERSGRVGFSARPRYAPAEGQLFLDDIQITTLEFNGLSDDYATLLKQRAPALLQGQLKAHPVYVLDTRTAQGSLAKLAVQDVKVVNGKLRISFVPAAGK